MDRTEVRTGGVVGAGRRRPAIELTVVCPFFDEEGVVGANLDRLAHRLAAMGLAWEIVAVDDGSTDAGRAEAASVARRDPRVRVIGYARNRGRGFALRAGIEAATGELVCTMEADAGYGFDVIADMVRILRREPDVDVVVVSPNMPGGGYVGVPKLRELATRWGNRTLRWAMKSGLTTHTGMTRCYRRRVIQSLPLHEDGKEFHLEVLSKALALGHVVVETPGTLTWPSSRDGHARLDRQVAVTRRNTRSHVRWALFAYPTRFVLHVGAWSFLMCVVAATLRLVNGPNAWNDVLVGAAAAFGELAVITLFLAAVSAQLRALKVEVWRMEQRRLLRHAAGALRARTSASSEGAESRR